MAGPVGSGHGSHGQRVFVLVDGDSARGVFFTWDAAEAFADENKYSLDKLMEYETGTDFPDHLHLMAAKWDEDWKFQGEWSKKTPDWPTPPKKIRLDHYHAKGNSFNLLRQREFDWESGLLLRINPMAPDEALTQAASNPFVTSESAQPWKPEITQVESFKPSQALPDTPEIPEELVEPVLESSIPKTGLSPIIEPPIEEIVKDSPRATPEQEQKPGQEPEQEPQKPKLKLGSIEETAALSKENSAEASGDLDETDSSPQIKFRDQKRKPALKLKKNQAPEPIPSFKPPEIPLAMDPGGKSSVELAQADSSAMALKKPVDPEFKGKPKRILSLKLIFSLALTLICWIAGVAYALRPEPTAASIVAEIATLSNARVIVIEPEMVFFQLNVDPAHQERWIQNMKMNPISNSNPVGIPYYHALDTWEKPDGFIRPPYADVEVDEWWDLRRRDVRHGFTRTWEDGSIMILDFESDTLIGWARAQDLATVLN